MPPALSSTVSLAHPACHLRDNNPREQMTMKRIHREIGDLKKEDLGAIVLVPTEENLYLWKGSIPGPEGSVYDGGVFNVEVVLPPDYPCVYDFSSIQERLVVLTISSGSLRQKSCSRQGTRPIWLSRDMIS